MNCEKRERNTIIYKATDYGRLVKELESTIIYYSGLGVFETETTVYYPDETLQP